MLTQQPLTLHIINKIQVLKMRLSIPYILTPPKTPRMDPNGILKSNLEKESQTILPQQETAYQEHKINIINQNPNTKKDTELIPSV